MRTTLALVAAAGLCACQKPQPSPEYQEARQRYAALLAGAPLDAAVRPEMDEVLSLLERVPPRSLDAEAAAALRARILDERRNLADEQARRARMVESAGTPTAWVQGAGGPGGAPGVATLPEEAPAAAPPRPPSQLAAGTPLADFQKAQGECFEAKAPATIAQREGKALQGEAWGLRESEDCKKSHPDEVGRLVLFADGKLLEVREAKEAKATAVTQNVKGIVGKDGAPALPPGTKLPPGSTLRWSPPPAPQQPPRAPGSPVPGTPPAPPPATPR